MSQSTLVPASHGLWPMHPLRSRILGEVHARPFRRMAAPRVVLHYAFETPPAAAGADRLIHGHTHRPGDERLGPGLSRHVLSDWDLDGQHGPARAEVLRLDARGLHRRPPSRLASRPC